VHAAESATPMAKPGTAPRVTLPGPSLPPQLKSFVHAGLSVVPGYQLRQAKPGVVGWIISIGITAVLVAGAVTLLSYLSASSAAKEQPADPPSVVASTYSGGSSLSKLIEVTGFRMVVDLNKKSEIHYLVVNHSAGELGGLTLWVTLRNVNAKAGQPPFA